MLASGKSVLNYHRVKITQLINAGKGARKGQMVHSVLLCSVSFFRCRLKDLIKIICNDTFPNLRCIYLLVLHLTTLPVTQTAILVYGNQTGWRGIAKWEGCERSCCDQTQAPVLLFACGACQETQPPSSSDDNRCHGQERIFEPDITRKRQKL